MTEGWVFVLIVGVGSFFGSVLHVLLGRVHERSVLWGRARCDHCQRALQLHHLVPVLSWVVLKGRCPDCGRRLHWQQPLIELILGGLFLVSYLRHPWLRDVMELAPFVFEAFLSSILIFLAAFDLRWKELPLEIIGGAAVILFLFSLLTKRFDLFSLLIAVVVALIVFGWQFWFSHGRWMGGGDPWMAVMIAVALGWPAFGFAVYFSYLFGGIFFATLYLGGWMKVGSRVPFAPWLAIGAMGALWLGDEMMLFLRGIW